MSDILSVDSSGVGHWTWDRLMLRPVYAHACSHIHVGIINGTMGRGFELEHYFASRPF